MAVTLTESAAKHVSNYIAKRGKGIGIRLGVKTSGCSGMAYKLEFADAAEPEDVVFDTHGLKVLVDPRSLPYIDGTELDYAKEGLNEGFKFNNPNINAFASGRAGPGSCAGSGEAASEEALRSSGNAGPHRFAYPNPSHGGRPGARFRHEVPS
jgi:iron-sulfur cluster assembly protein